jgi:hypothetical protein
MNKNIFMTRGNIEILNQKKVALFTSRDTPQDLFPHIEALFNILRKMGAAVAGGWQAPFEKKMYKDIRPTDKSNYIYYLAKDINQLRLSQSEENLVNNAKLLFVAPNFKGKRISKSLVTARDELLFAQNNKILFFYISRGGRLEEYYKQLNPQVFQIYILDHPVNRHFFANDVTAVNEDNINIIFNL